MILNFSMSGAYGLYGHIQRNRLKSVLLLLSFILLLQALIFSFTLLYEASFGGSFSAIKAMAVSDMQIAAPAGLALAGLWFALAYAFHQWLIDRAVGAVEMQRARAPKLFDLLENLCISRGMPMPRLSIMASPALNAFASGLSAQKASIAVTQGLIDALAPDEIEAVLAHELTHIRNRDTQLLVIAIIFSGLFAFVGDMSLRNWDFPFGRGPRLSSNGNEESRSNNFSAQIWAGLLAAAIIMASWGLSRLAQLALSRSREYLADAGAVELTKNPDALIAALQKISRHAKMPEIPSRMSAFFIESPLKHPSDDWMSTHPSLESRIEALKRFAGGRRKA